ncbi:MAG: energy transducer TonB [Candidatus Marinimicrobia bacterium]|nr:energy transducer TonB [Candidatus Neomarinimicrobiota bacterium]MBT4360665.1 energy transducer TonB [Candidatus Neomarinimicrobiota bacterium]MBT4715917.1 energy transducer TonB [Candidatus Neomarinimicrobiota bacterium]MBT4948150.1 energy transducer TonB [Candidatus Neomarinimicrobiota bacterium]MBT5271032.1 energy transducer TonB [Candidatus Neomarinimicrobiota bacterium]
MKFRSQLIVVFAMSILISHCISPQNPLEGIDIPEPENADESYYFFRAARVVRYKQKDKLVQARNDLERVIKADQRILYPEAYPFLIEVYNQLEISDSSAWIYPEALAKIEADQKLSEKYSARFGEWQKAYPEYPAEFQDREYKLLDSGVEPVGGYKRLYQILEYPEMAREMNRTGVSWFSIIIEADGTLQDVQLLKSSYPDLDEAALKAINASNWVAAKYDERPVTFQIILPIHFRL